MEPPNAEKSAQIRKKKCTNRFWLLYGSKCHQTWQKQCLLHSEPYYIGYFTFTICCPLVPSNSIYGNILPMGLKILLIIVNSPNLVIILFHRHIFDIHHQIENSTFGDPLVPNGSHIWTLHWPYIEIYSTNGNVLGTQYKASLKASCHPSRTFYLLWMSIYGQWSVHIWTPMATYGTPKIFFQIFYGQLLEGPRMITFAQYQHSILFRLP